MRNLDRLAAQTAQEIINNTKTFNNAKLEATKVDNLITKALGVLQENGVYAALLYLYSRTEKADNFVAEKTREKLLSPSLRSELGLPELGNYGASTALQFLTDKICNDLDRLLLVKQLWEQTLIYTRYGAKARSVEEKIAEEAKKAKEEAKKAQEEAEKVKSEP